MLKVILLLIVGFIWGMVIYIAGTSWTERPIHFTICIITLFIASRLHLLAHERS